MDLQITFLDEKLLAIGAREGLLPGVGSHVLLKMKLFKIRLGALGADVQFLPCVFCEMFAKVH
jgi:hypothetical protein